MFRNRMLGGSSFLPLFAPDAPVPGEIEPGEAEHGDPEFAEAPEGAAAEGAEAAEAAEGAEPVAAAEAIAEGAAAADAQPEKTAAELKADLEESERVRKGLTRRLGAVSAEKRELSSKLQATIAAVPKTPTEAPAEGEAEQPVRTDFKTQAEFDAAVRTEAKRVAAQEVAVQTWNAKCNAVEDAGSKAFGAKWVEAKNNLGILDDEGRIPKDLLVTALETDNPAQALFALGSNLDKATELMAMTPLKRAIAMDRLAQIKPAERARSKAPAPIEPINGGGGGNDAPSDRDSDAEWHRKEGLREAEKRKKRLGLA